MIVPKPASVAPRAPKFAVLALVFALVLALAGCTGGPVSTPPISPGSSSAPREVNIIARDYSFAPSPVDLVPGETVLLHVINAGLVVHEAVIGDMTVQDVWEAAEAESADPPPGPTPVVSVPPDVSGLRVVVESGQRVDVTYTVPASADPATPWFVGCHIPGHWEQGMVVPVRFVGGDGGPQATS